MALDKASIHLRLSSTVAAYTTNDFSRVTMRNARDGVGDDVDVDAVADADASPSSSMERVDALTTPVTLRRKRSTERSITADAVRTRWWGVDAAASNALASDITTDV